MSWVTVAALVIFALALWAYCYLWYAMVVLGPRWVERDLAEMRRRHEGEGE